MIVRAASSSQFVVSSSPTDEAAALPASESRSPSLPPSISMPFLSSFSGLLSQEDILESLRVDAVAPPSSQVAAAAKRYGRQQQVDTRRKTFVVSNLPGREEDVSEEALRGGCLARDRAARQEWKDQHVRRSADVRRAAVSPTRPQSSPYHSLGIQQIVLGKNKSGGPIKRNPTATSSYTNGCVRGVHGRGSNRASLLSAGGRRQTEFMRRPFAPHDPPLARGMTNAPFSVGADATHASSRPPSASVDCIQLVRQAQQVLHQTSRCLSAGSVHRGREQHMHHVRAASGELYDACIVPLPDLVRRAVNRV